MPRRVGVLTVQDEMSQKGQKRAQGPREVLDGYQIRMFERDSFGKNDNDCLTNVDIENLYHFLRYFRVRSGEGYVLFFDGSAYCDCVMRLMATLCSSFFFCAASPCLSISSCSNPRSTGPTRSCAAVL